MDKNNRKTPESIECRYVIKIYRDGYRYPRITQTVDSDPCYAEIHSVNGTGDDQYLGPGRPLTFDFFRKILSFENRNSYSGDISKELFDSRIIYFGSLNGIHRIIWWEKGCEKEMYIKGKKPLKCRVPSMVFCLRNYSKFFVFAMKGISRPKMNTALYNPPFNNTYPYYSFESSNVCLGNVNIDSSMVSNPNHYVGEYEKYWWKSEFEGIHDLLNISKEKGRFPTRRLVKPVITVKHLFS